MLKGLSYGSLIVLLCCSGPSSAGDCTRPPNIEHGRQMIYRSSYPNGFKVKYICEKGYAMFFADTIHCDNGFWMTETALGSFDRLTLPQCKLTDNDGGNRGIRSFVSDANAIFVAVVVVTVILTIVVCCLRLSYVQANPRGRRGGVQFFTNPQVISYNGVGHYKSSAPPPPPTGQSTSLIRRPSMLSASLDDSFECYSLTPSLSSNKLEALHVAEVA